MTAPSISASPTDSAAGSGSDKRLVQRYRWAGAAAAAIMGKNKHWGSEPTNAADDDPLAWWTLTELIAIGGPKL